MALLVGGLLAFTVGLMATVAGLDRDRAFYPTLTIVIASYYALFAVMGASTHLFGFVLPEEAPVGITSLRERRVAPPLTTAMRTSGGRP